MKVVLVFFLFFFYAYETAYATMITQESFEYGNREGTRLTLNDDGEFWSIEFFLSKPTIDFGGNSLLRYGSGIEGLNIIRAGYFGHNQGYFDITDVKYGLNGNLNNISIDFYRCGQDESLELIGEFCSAPAPVPEPTTMILFGTGLLGLSTGRLRRKKTSVKK